MLLQKQKKCKHVVLSKFYLVRLFHVIPAKILQFACIEEPIFLETSLHSSAEALD